MQHQIQFSFPLSDNSSPKKHLTDLGVFGYAVIGRNKELLESKINKITHAAKGEIYTSDIKDVLRVYSHSLYLEIKAAFKNHIESVYHAKEVNQEATF